MNRRATGLAVVLAVGISGAFLAGFSLRGTPAEDRDALASGVTIGDRVASLRMRVAAVERENDNLRTELKVRSALEHWRRRLSEQETDRIVASILEAHNRYGLSTEFLLAVIDAESSFDIDAVSRAGAMGLMQVMPATGREMAQDLNIDWTGETMLHDPAINIQLGSEYLHRMFRKFGHADNALAAYNAGPTRVRGLNHAGIHPQVYSGRVRRSLERYSR